MSIDFRSLLNPQQLEAVESINGPLLILAGAGSGKTRVITFRIAHMLEQKIHQSSILALTFTNKAAAEMAERIRELTKKKLSNLTVSTFHAFGVRLLREYITYLGYRNNFTIYDQTDVQSLIKEVALELKYPRDKIDSYKLCHLFSRIKTGQTDWDEYTEAHKDLFAEYQSHLKVYNAVDFDDLILLPIKLFKEFPEILEKCRKRYQYMLIDEYQDTSENQYDFMKQIADGSRNVCVVGDDDQSIYSWRGACFENILKFERDFPEVKEIRLEQNYRSTGKILLAANKVIANNAARKDKELWTGASEGESIKLFMPENEKKEGEYIVEQIKALKYQYKIPYHEFGVLVRTNGLTRPLEEAFLSENIPYKVSGGISFFQRKEVKDIVSYLRLIVNPDDDMNLLRVINVPRRGLGKKTIEKINQLSAKMSCSLYSVMAALRVAADSPFPKTVQVELADFIGLIEYYRERFLENKKLAETLQSLVERIDYWGHLVGEYKKQNVAKWKYLNIESLINSLASYENDPDNLSPSLYNYLHRITLFSKDDQDDQRDGDKLNLMTIHSAKGLEFDTVFLAGVEKDIIPHARTLEEGKDNLEEERRLFYVALTRAKQRLYICACRARHKRAKLEECEPSPFLHEIPAHLIEHDEGKLFVSTNEAEQTFSQLKARFKN